MNLSSIHPEFPIGDWKENIYIRIPLRVELLKNDQHV